MMKEIFSFFSVLQIKIINIFPTIRIGRIMRAKTRKEVLRLCDKFDNNMEDNPTVYFDRSVTTTTTWWTTPQYTLIGQ